MRKTQFWLWESFKLVQVFVRNDKEVDIRTEKFEHRCFALYKRLRLVLFRQTWDVYSGETDLAVSLGKYGWSILEKTVP